MRYELLRTIRVGLSQALNVPITEVEALVSAFEEQEHVRRFKDWTMEEWRVATGTIIALEEHGFRDAVVRLIIHAFKISIEDLGGEGLPPNKLAQAARTLPSAPVQTPKTEPMFALPPARRSRSRRDDKTIEAPAEGSA